MPGENAEYAPEQLGMPDLYPTSEEEHQALVTWALQAFQAADAGRRQHEEKWDKYYRMFRSYVERTVGDWRSKVFVPYVFSTIETILPRIVASSPRFLCAPVGPEDVEPAKVVEMRLNYCAQQSGLQYELLEGEKSALIYGTGLLKTFYKTDIRTAYQQQQVPVEMEEDVEREVVDPETGEVMIGPNGQPVTETTTETSTELQTQMAPFEFVAYDGPDVVALDLYDFWIAPEASDVQSARYAIHRVFKEMGYVLAKVKDGVYRLPEGMGPADVADIEDEPLARRLATINLGPGSQQDSQRKPVELLEFWTDDGRVITMANRKAILRVTPNPYWHGQKPFVRIVDYPVPNEFYGIGEVESIEGLQDIQNVLVNTRLDAVRLTSNPMFGVDVTGIEDPRDLRVRPGGTIRTRGGLPVRDVFERIDMGDVTDGAFAEAEQMERLIERVTGVSPITAGLDSPSYNDTATGASLMMEAANTKFGMKLRMLELSLREVAQHWGALIQQFTSEEALVRFAGPGGQYVFGILSPDSVQGALDFDIEVSSTAQVATARRQESMQLLQSVGAVWPNAIPKLVQDVLEAFDRKDIPGYMWGAQMGMLPGMTPVGVPPQMMLGAGAPAQPGQQPQPGQPAPEEGATA